MTITKETIGESYEDIKKFNEKTGNFTGDMEQLVDDQLSKMFDWLTDAIDGFELEKEESLLAGAVGSFIAVVGLLQKLEAAGFNVEQALHKGFLRTSATSSGMVIPSSWSVSEREYGSIRVLDENNQLVFKCSTSVSDCVPNNFFNNK